MQPIIGCFFMNLLTHREIGTKEEYPIDLPFLLKKQTCALFFVQ